jgi:hypothetical protein
MRRGINWFIRAAGILLILGTLSYFVSWFDYYKYLLDWGDSLFDYPPYVFCHLSMLVTIGLGIYVLLAKKINIVLYILLGILSLFSFASVLAYAQSLYEILVFYSYVTSIFDYLYAYDIAFILLNSVVVFQAIALIICLIVSKLIKNNKNTVHIVSLIIIGIIAITGIITSLVLAIIYGVQNNWAFNDSWFVSMLFNIMCITIPFNISSILFILGDWKQKKDSIKGQSIGTEQSSNAEDKLEEPVVEKPEKDEIKPEEKKELKHCPYCGSEISQDVFFCQSCGKKL